MEQDLIQSGRKQVPIAAEFHRIYPKAESFVSHFTGEGGPSVWNSQMNFYDRYRLNLAVPVSINHREREVTQSGKWTMILTEVKSLERLPDGRLDERIGESWNVGEKEWAQITKDGGDLSSYPVRKDAPVKLFPSSPLF